MQRYVIGIDLGTTNTVMAFADRDAGGEIRTFEIEQLVAPGEVAARSQLPSLRYQAAPGEFAPGDLTLPWSDGGDPIVGALAQLVGTQVPGRLVASAKSWLSHRSVDRTADILPWGAEQGVAKISPVAASASYLAHLGAAWNHAHPDHPLERQEVVLTVPASFDEGARALTVEAAHQAGIPHLRLLEEPQAACYDWLQHQADGLAAALADSRLVLVCDVGGGTTDLTLVRVEHTPDGPRLARVGVGDHLMLGGDNMDLALAHLAEGRLTGDGGRLSAAQLAQLAQQCRAAKERLLAPDAPERASVTVLGAGSRLVGGARSAELTRGEVEALVRDGFFPHAQADEAPRRTRGGLVEFGLPYVTDPAVTRHVAAFLARHQRVVREALAGLPAQAEAVPDTLLLNGGVFRCEALSERLLETLEGWRGAPVRRLENDHPDRAVARGAVAYALARSGAGTRIGGGSARSFFLALEDEAEGSHGICLLPRGSEEGREVRLAGRRFLLRVGQPVAFRLLSSSADTPWQAGELVELDAAEMLPLPPVAAVLDAKAAGGAPEVQVTLAAQLTEVGTLEVDCLGDDPERQRWRLEFQLRGGGGAPAEAPTLPPGFAAAAERVEHIFGRHKRPVESREVKGLRSGLERILGPRDDWDGTLLRELFGVLWEGAGKRRRSADHEALWLNLAGFCLRPGFGHPLDDWRVEQLWSLYDDGIQFSREARNWAEWWILWRRIAGGLEEPAQLRILDDLVWYLDPAPKGKRPPGPKQQGYDDMVRLAASLERLPVARKEELGSWFLQRLRKSKENVQTWWAIGRLGIREPVYGSAHQVVPPEVAERWLEPLLEQDWRRVEHAAFAAALIARCTGDRGRDLDDAVRERVLQRLAASKAPTAWAQMVRETVVLEAAEQKRLLGDALPVGLKLLR